MRPAGRWSYAALFAVVLGSAFPLCWSFLLASQDNEAIGSVPPTLTPGGNLLQNATRVFGQVEFAKAIVNSLVVAGSITVSVVVSSTLAGFAFAKLRFRGRQALMIMVIATMLIPVQLGVIPLYILMAELGWTGRIQSVIVPFLVSAFGVFFMRQYLVRAVPDELLEAARIDGCSTTGMVRHVVVPAARPAAAVLGLFTFVQAWNDFLWPLVVLTPEDPTVPVALSALASGYYEDYALVLTGTVIGTVPMLVVFALLGRHIIGEFMRGGVN
ncbi:carbohydrate ABC transporter permease [Streptomyces sp. NBC_00829]|uniref:carbohydrate ABC transporter permease n=1 Tax=Streptomyces sp. NBC_00829 TaxID=2903679 RepID=UPI003863D8DF|nr:carbohydrate ABC transporter permease [Streptomyces sp. NBC_00829]